MRLNIQWMLRGFHWWREGRNDDDGGEVEEGWSQNGDFQISEATYK